MGQLLSTDPNLLNFKELLFVAFLLSLYITGIFAFLGFAYPTNLLIPKRYYSINDPHALNQICKTMGVRYYKYLLLLFFWGRSKNRLKYFDGTRKGFTNLIFQSKQSEFGHAMALIGIDIVSFILLIKGFYLLVLILLVFNILGNLYPILIQRQHRMRIDRLI